MSKGYNNIKSFRVTLYAGYNNFHSSLSDIRNLNTAVKVSTLSTKRVVLWIWNKNAENGVLETKVMSKVLS